MRTKNLTGLLAVLLMTVFCSPLAAYAQNPKATDVWESFKDGRNIYVGDILTLEIMAEGLSTEELKEKFSAFEIMELKEEAGRYLITLRTFEPGEYKVTLRNKEITITVASTLDDIQREEPFEGGTQVIESEPSFPWRILFTVSTSIFLLSGGVLLFRTLVKKRAKALPPYELFLRSSSALAIENDNYFVDLTFLFKQYIESLYQCRLIGKTSDEMISQMKEIQALHALLPDMEAWLKECDRLKFTCVKVSPEIKQEHYGKLLELVNQIHLLSIDRQKEGAA